MIEHKLKLSAVKSGIAALAAVSLVGCGNESEKCTEEEAKNAYDYCHDYAGKYACSDCEECVARKYGSSCEKHCEGSSTCGGIYK